MYLGGNRRWVPLTCSSEIVVNFGWQKQSQVYWSEVLVKMIWKENEEKGMFEETTVHKNSVCLALVL